MNKITDQIERDVNAEIARITNSGETALAQAIRDQLGPERTWTNRTPGMVRTLEQRECDGRAG